MADFNEIIVKSAAEWAQDNPVLAEGQLGIESDVRNGVQTGTVQGKMGDGVSRWASLSYWQPTSLATITADIAAIQAQLATPLVYRALLTQTGTDAPVATVFTNTLGGTVVWTRASDGLYSGTLVGAFPAAGTLPFTKLTIASGDVPGLAGGARLSDDVYQISTYLMSDLTARVDDAFTASSLVCEILVYP